MIELQVLGEVLIHILQNALDMITGWMLRLRFFAHRKVISRDKTSHSYQIGDNTPRPIVVIRAVFNFHIGADNESAQVWYLMIQIKGSQIDFMRSLPVTVKSNGDMILITSGTQFFKHSLRYTMPVPDRRTSMQSR